jgi:hypothetical protein
MAPKAKPAEATNIATLVRRKEIQQDLKHTLRTLQEKTRIFETERSSLLLEVEEVKKVAEI